MSKRSFKHLATGALLLAGTVSGVKAQSPITLLSNFAANQSGGFSAGEIVSFDKTTNRLFVTSSGSGVFRVNMFDVSNPSAPTVVGAPIDFSTTFGAAANMSGLSSVAVDPLGRFGVATLIPTNNTTTTGQLGFFDLTSGAVIGTTSVGFHPDSVSFSADGSKIVVVNEGEFNPNTGTFAGTNAGNVNAPGSISILDVSAITSGSLNSLPALVATTTDFSAGNLGAGVSIANLRNSNLAAVGTSGTFIGSVPVFNSADPNAIEPEYASIRGDKVFVSLQENNAIAEYDLNTNKWSNVTSLGKISVLIDATDTGNSININKTVSGLFMPDTIASYEVGGKRYVLTANEGDARVDDRDISRFGDIAGSDSMNPLLDTNAPSNFPLTQTGVRADSELGRLNVSRIDGDTDADGKIDDPTMIGTRSFSIWEDTETGLTRVYDSGSFFEKYIRDFDATGWMDSRSDDKGPEPEGLTLGVIGDRTYAFVSMERTSSIFMFDVTNPLAPNFWGYYRIGTGSVPLRPEGMNFISAADSPTGHSLLVVGFEGDGTSATNERVAVFQVVPEPSSIATLMLGTGALIASMRRRSRLASPAAHCSTAV